MKAVAVALLLLLSNATNAAAQTAGGTPSAGISDGVVKIGLLLDMVGPYSDQTGAGSAAAAQMAVEDEGGKVLGAPVQLVVADHHNSSDQAATIARRWFSDEHVDAILDVAGSSEAVLVQAIARNRNKIVSISAALAARLSNEACSPTAVHYAFDTYSVAHTMGQEMLRRGDDTWFFITVDYTYGYDLEADMTTVVLENGGTVLGRARHPLNTSDFSAYLEQAKQSQAKAIGVINAGTDATNTFTQAAKLGMIPGPQVFAALGLRFTGVARLGLPTAQGMMVAEPFYWDSDDETRAWSKRFFARVERMPNSLQAALYSSTRHYLQSIAKAGTDATEPVMQAMRELPVNDFFARNGHIRIDGTMVHDMHLFQVKSPVETRYPWDYYRPIATVPGDRAFRPLAESKCPLVKQ